MPDTPPPVPPPIAPSGSTDITIREQKRRLVWNRGFTLGDKYCEIQPTGCCDTTSPPSTTPQLKVEKQRLTLPPGARLGPSWCRTNPINCCTSGSGSGSDNTVIVPCCPNPISKTLTMTIANGTGDCSCFDGTYTLDWNGVDRWTYFGTICGGKALSIEVTWIGDCGGGFYLVVKCDGQFTFLSWFLSQIGGVQDCGPPLYLYGRFIAEPGSTCCGPFERVDITVTEDGVITGTNLQLLVRYQRIYLPPGITASTESCRDNTQDCCEGEVTLDGACCADTPFPRMLYVTFLNVTPTGSGSDCSGLEGHTIRMDFTDILSTWLTPQDINHCAALTEQSIVYGDVIILDCNTGGSPPFTECAVVCDIDAGLQMYRWCAILASLQCDTYSGKWTLQIYRTDVISQTPQLSDAVMGTVELTNTIDFNLACKRPVFHVLDGVQIDDPTGGGYSFCPCGTVVADVVITE